MKKAITLFFVGLLVAILVFSNAFAVPEGKATKSQACEHASQTGIEHAIEHANDDSVLSRCVLLPPPPVG